MVKLAVGQMRVEPGDIDANLGKMLAFTAGASALGAQAIVLPEVALTGLVADMRTVAQPIPGPATDKLGEAARAGEIWVIAGMPESNPDGAPFNSAVVISSTGEVAAIYRKVFLYLQEADGFARGRAACLLDLGFARVGLTICYDYVFPEYVRRLVLGGAQLILHPTAWVDTQTCREWQYPAAEAYRAQCLVRALENGVFFASANVMGAYDAGGYLEGVGRSAIIAPWGEVLAEVTDDEGVALAELDFGRVEEWTTQVAPYLRDFRKVPLPPV